MAIGRALPVEVHGNGRVVGHDFPLEDRHSLVDVGGVLDDRVDLVVVLELSLGLGKVSQFGLIHLSGEPAPVLGGPVQIKSRDSVGALSLLVVIFVHLSHGLLHHVSLKHSGIRSGD